MNRFLKKMVIMFAYLIAFTTMVYAAPIGGKLSINNVTAMPGETVDVPIKISNNTGICGATLKISYDTNLVLTNVTSGNAFSSLTMTKPGKLSSNPIKIVWDGLDEDTSNGTIAILSFTVPNKAGSYAVSASYTNGDIMDGNLEALDIEITNGAITVSSGTVVPEPHTCTWNSGVNTKEPTCIKEGIKTYTCTVCGKTKTETIAEKGHSISDGKCKRCNLPGGYSGSTVVWAFNETTGEISFTGTGNMKKYFGYTERSWLKYVPEIKSVFIQNGITNISDYAFYSCPKLKTVTIPDSCANIGEFAFKNCSELETVNMPKKLTKLGESAFFACSKLRSITIPEGIYTVWAYTFKNCESLEEVRLPKTLIKIDEAAFYGCASMEELNIPNSCNIIGQYAFKNCTSLKSLNIPSTLIQIREAAFYATAIETLDIPEGVTQIGPYAFKKCSALVTLNMPNTVTTIMESAFYGSAIKTLVLPDSVKTIGAYAFKGCEKLDEIIFSKNLQTIGDSAFYYCTALTTINLPEGLSKIDGYAFKNCTKLTKVNLPNTLTVLGDSAFYSCTSLGEITIPQNVTSIGAYCFSKDTALNKIYFAGNAPIIKDGAFSKVVAKVYVPNGNGTWTNSVKQNYGGTITWGTY